MYPYKVLNSAKSEIRLLQIQCSNGAADIEWNLVSVALVNDLEFTALSYVWGDSSVTEDIVVDGYFVPVTTNLASALRYVKQHWQEEFPDRDVTSFRLWADAVCIDQSNTSERNSQVQLMSMLYSKAELVIFWLGAGKVEVTFAMEMLDLIARETKNATKDQIYMEWMRNHPILCHEDRNDQNCPNPWTSISRFWELPYWQRVWIFQELVLGSSKGIIVHGSASLRWDVVDQASGWLLFTNECLEKSHHPLPDFINSDAWRALAGGQCHPWPVINVTSAKMIAAKEDLRDHASIFRFIRRLRATDPRDHIYGLLGIAKLDVIPDYRKELRDVYRDLAIAQLNATERLDWLSHGGMGSFDRDSRLPSWAPNFIGCSETKGGIVTSFGGYSNADWNVFQGPAAKPTILEFKLTAFAALGPRVITLETASPMDAYVDGGLPDFVDNYLSRHPIYITGIHALRALFEVFENIQGEMIPRHLYLSRAFGFFNTLAYSASKSMLGKRPNLDQLRPLTDEQKIALFFKVFAPETAAADLHILAQMDLNGVVLGREYFLLQYYKLASIYRLVELEHGYLGLAPKGASPGDIVAVVRGCEGLLLLRQEGDHYVLVGTCWVVGLMQGSMRALVERGDTVLKNVEIW